MKEFKKLFLTLGIIFSIGFVTPVIAQDQFTPPPNHKQQAQQNFEKRLNLTEKQKKKAKAIHQKGFEQMKPIMKQIAQKHKELGVLKKSSDAESQEKLVQTKEELKVLEKKAADIRKENSKEFEKILNKKQKAELEKMKAEGRARFEKKHPPKKPFDMFGAPNFWNQRPLFPPPMQPKE